MQADPSRCHNNLSRSFSRLESEAAAKACTLVIDKSIKTSHLKICHLLEFDALYLDSDIVKAAPRK